MLQAYYGGDDNSQSFELSYPVALSTAFGALPPGVTPTRSFASIAQAEQEGNDARVFGGLHYRSSVNVADIEGRTIAAYVMANFWHANQSLSRSVLPILVRDQSHGH